MCLRQAQRGGQTECFCSREDTPVYTSVQKDKTHTGTAHRDAHRCIQMNMNEYQPTNTPTHTHISQMYTRQTCTQRRELNEKAIAHGLAISSGVKATKDFCNTNIHKRTKTRKQTHQTRITNTRRHTSQLHTDRQTYMKRTTSMHVHARTRTHTITSRKCNRR